MADIGITVNVKKLGWEDYKAALTAGGFDMLTSEVRLSPDFDLELHPRFRQRRPITTGDMTRRP